MSINGGKRTSTFAQAAKNQLQSPISEAHKRNTLGAGYNATKNTELDTSIASNKTPTRRTKMTRESKKAETGFVEDASNTYKWIKSGIRGLVQGSQSQIEEESHQSIQEQIDAQQMEQLLISERQKNEDLQRRIKDLQDAKSTDAKNKDQARQVQAAALENLK